MGRHQDPRPGEGQTRSNIKDADKLAAWRVTAFDAQNREVHQLRSAFTHRMRALLTDEVTAAAKAAIDKHRAAWNASLALVIGDREKMAQTKQQHRKALDQSLRRIVPEYDAIQTLRRDFATDYRTVVETNPPAAAGELAVHPSAWADDLDNFGMKVYEAPFDATELLSFPDGTAIQTNHSAAFPDLGWVLNDITWRDDNAFGEIYDPDTFAGNDVSVGVNFQAPQTGFLNVAVDMENLFNYIHVWGTDNFGFSSATVNVYHSAFILLYRGGERAAMTFQHIVANGWVDPGGDDFSYTFPDVPTGPVVFVAAFDDQALHAQEQVQILAAVRPSCEETSAIWTAQRRPGCCGKSTSSTSG